MDSLSLANEFWKQAKSKWMSHFIHCCVLCVLPSAQAAVLKRCPWSHQWKKLHKVTNTAVTLHLSIKHLWDESHFWLCRFNKGSILDIQLKLLEIRRKETQVMTSARQPSLQVTVSITLNVIGHCLVGVSLVWDIQACVNCVFFTFP